MKTITRLGELAPSTLGLRGIDLLKGMPEQALELVATKCRWRRFGPGQRVISREAADDDVYMIVSGRVRVTAFSASGREVSYGELRAGHWFGDFAAIDGKARSADVVAVEETLLASMSPAVFRDLLRSNPDVCERMLQRLVRCVRDLTDRVFDFSTLDVQNRVYAELLRRAKEAGVYNNSARIDPAPKHSEIAGQVSTYREQVTRELSLLTKQGLVSRCGRALIIVNVSRLQQLVTNVRRARISKSRNTANV